MYLGRYQRGSEIYITLQATKQDGVTPDVPESAPFIQVYIDGNPPLLLQTVVMSAYQPGAFPGSFRASMFLGNLYTSTGDHFCVVRWVDSDGLPCTQAYRFELIAGGDGNGSIISMTEVVRPDARYLLCQTDAGNLIRRKNPR